MTSARTTLSYTASGSKDKRAYRNGFTIVKDPRFLINKDEHWPMRVELEPIYDKKNQELHRKEKWVR